MRCSCTAVSKFGIVLCTNGVPVESDSRRGSRQILRGFTTGGFERRLRSMEVLAWMAT